MKDSTLRELAERSIRVSDGIVALESRTVLLLLDRIVKLRNAFNRIEACNNGNSELARQDIMTIIDTTIDADNKAQS